MNIELFHTFTLRFPELKSHPALFSFLSHKATEEPFKRFNKNGSQRRSDNNLSSDYIHTSGLQATGRAEAWFSSLQVSPFSVTHRLKHHGCCLLEIEEQILVLPFCMHIVVLYHFVYFTCKVDANLLAGPPLTPYITLENNLSPLRIPFRNRGDQLLFILPSVEYQRLNV